MSWILEKKIVNNIKNENIKKEYIFKFNSKNRLKLQTILKIFYSNKFKMDEIDLLQDRKNINNYAVISKITLGYIPLIINISDKYIKFTTINDIDVFDYIQTILFKLDNIDDIFLNSIDYYTYNTYEYFKKIYNSGISIDDYKKLFKLNDNKLNKIYTSVKQVPNDENYVLIFKNGKLYNQISYDK